MLIKWSGAGRYMVVELFRKTFLIKEEGTASGEVIKYTYTPFLRRKVEFKQNGVRLIYNDFEEYKKACQISGPPKWVRRSQLIE